MDSEKVGSGPSRSKVVGVEDGDSAIAFEGDNAMNTILPDLDESSDDCSAVESNGAIVR